MTDIIPLRRALISVSDKSGIVDFASALAGADCALISTGGTAGLLREAGLKVADVSDVTGFPEMMDGRVKTLHPKVHGGLLALRDKDDHRAAMDAHDIEGIDLLCVNLYPFEATVAAGADAETVIENIDIGGPAMIRSAAKNHRYVTVLTDAEDYARVLDDLLAHGGTTLETRRMLAAKAFQRTAAYDAAIGQWFAGQQDNPLPKRFSLAGEQVQSCRYGENPHQQAAFYRSTPPRPGVASATQLQGKELSYNNLNDTDAAYELISDLPADQPAVAIIKHANPCGVATGATLLEAYKRALMCDPVSAFGGIVAVNQPLDGDTAAAITEVFTEVVIAPTVSDDARAIFAKKKNLRLLEAGALADPAQAGMTVKTLAGGFLVQSRDTAVITEADLRVVTKRAPTPGEIADMLFAFQVAKHVKSNAIVYARGSMTVGIGAGQMNRRDSSRIAAIRAGEAAEAARAAASFATDSVVASDAFFPFADGLLAAAEAGATAVIQPGGSVRDDEVIAAADAAGLAMVFTDRRHFRH